MTIEFREPDLTNNAIIIYGPQACGKSRNAFLLAEHFKKYTIIDNWTPDMELPSNSLALTNVPTPGAITYEDAMWEMKNQEIQAEKPLEQQKRYLSEEWRIGIKDEIFTFTRYVNGEKNESYFPVQQSVASVWMLAIIQGYQPPRALFRLDKPV